MGHASAIKGNVMGLPVELLVNMLQRLETSILDYA